MCFANSDGNKPGSSFNCIEFGYNMPYVIDRRSKNKLNKVVLQHLIINKEEKEEKKRNLNLYDLDFKRRKTLAQPLCESKKTRHYHARICMSQYVQCLSPSRLNIKTFMVDIRTYVQTGDISLPLAPPILQYN